MTGAARIRVGDPPHGPLTAAPTPPEVIETVLMSNGRERNVVFVGSCHYCGRPVTRRAWCCYEHVALMRADRG